MLAVTGGKGGVGKTTVTMALAAALARRGERPVVVDADLDLPNLAAVAGVAPDGLGQLATGGPLAAVPTVAGVRVVGAEQGRSLDDLSRVFDHLADGPPVLVDCPAGTGRHHGFALASAERALLVTHATRASVTDAVKAERLARQLGATPRGVLFNEATQTPSLEQVFRTPTIEAVQSVDSPPVWRALSERLPARFVSRVRQNI